MKNYIIVLLVLFSFVSCTDTLNITPTDSISGDLVFQDKALIEASTYDIMNKVPHGLNKGGGFLKDGNLASATDQAVGKSGWTDAVKLSINGVSERSHYGLDIWGSTYKVIRKVAIFEEGIQTSPFDEAYNNAQLARVRFIRANKYFEMARRYGDVPLITEVLDPAVDDIMTPASSVDEVYDFVYDELNDIVQYLPDISEAVTGDISKQAAIAMNARAMMYAGRWQQSADLNAQLVGGALQSTLALAQNRREMLLDNGGSVESIYEIQTSVPDRGNRFAYRNYPVRWRNDNGGQTDPTQEFVDYYEMADGTEFDWNNPTMAANPYANRDPRFYEDIFFHGALFEGLKPLRGEPFIDMEWNNNNEGPGDKHDGNASISGYFVKKFANPADGTSPKSDHSGNSSWKELRYAEVLLNYAEALNEANNAPTQAVYDAINAIRTRSNMPTIATGQTKEQMRETIRHERRIELAFENHRYFDLRRWRTAHSVLHERDFHGIKVLRKATAPNHTDAPQLAEAEHFDFIRFVIPGRTKTFPESNYWLPYPRSELDKNSSLDQNHNTELGY